jgi:DNA-binding MarR family transcriptional regulator
MTKDQTHHDSLGLLLRLTHQRWTLAVDTKLAEEGFDDIKPHHANIFTFVPPEGIQVSRLTELAHVRKQSMTQTVEELEKLGYVERRPDQNDKRGKLVFLTERGKKVSPIARAAGKLVDQNWADLTSVAEIEALRNALRSVLAATARRDQDEGC